MLLTLRAICAVFALILIACTGDERRNPYGDYDWGNDESATEYDDNDDATNDGEKPKSYKGAATSRLGMHVLGGGEGAQTLLNSCPRVVKWLSIHIPNLKAFREQCPNTQVVVRLWIDPAQVQYRLSENPVTCANHYWSKVQGEVNKLKADYVDWLEGPNEADEIEKWFDSGGEWYAQFAGTLADLMNKRGFTPLVGSIPVGNGSGASLRPLANAIRARNYKIGWSYHSYSKNLTRNMEEEKWTTFRYREIARNGGFQGIPLVLSEAGQDAVGGGGWQKLDWLTNEEYLDWLKWFDGELRQPIDKDVVGATLFQVGDTGKWASFSVGPISQGLAAHINASKPRN